jgi:hypothetical protein
MQIMDLAVPVIDGAELVASHLGGWPSFHDAEITQVHIERDGHSTVTLRLVGTWLGESVTFTFEKILDLTLDGEDVNRQNVIGALAIEKVGQATKVTFSPCYGLCGHITAERVGVQVAAR